MKKIIAFITLLALVLGALPALADPSEREDLPGRAFPDFSFVDTEGNTVIFSELLKEKELVVVSLFATWCSSCSLEFPEMKQVAGEYPDQIEVIGLSAYENDTPEKIAKYREKLDLPFHMGVWEGTGLQDFVRVSYYPTNIFIDRFGNVCFASGVFPTTDSFRRTVEAFLGDDYTRTAPLTEIPTPEVDVDYPSAEELNAALNISTGELEFASDEASGAFPFVPRAEQGRYAVYASSVGKTNAATVLRTHVTAEVNDALVFQADCVTHYGGRLTVLVDDKQVKGICSTRGWETFEIPLTSGEHDVEFRYEQTRDSRGEEHAAIDCVSMKRTDGQYGYVTMRLMNEDARKAYITEDGQMTDVGIDVTQEPIVRVGLLYVPDGVDPDQAFVYNAETAETTSLSLLPREYGNYIYECPNARPGEFMFLEFVDDVTSDNVCSVSTYVTGGEAGIEAYVDEYRDLGYQNLDWAYEDEPEAAEEEFEEGAEDEATYTVTVLDQNGDPVSGASVGFCLDAGCVPVECDENGVATFTGAPDAYHVRVIDAPEGYDYPDDTDIYTEAGSDSLTLTITRESN